MFVPRLSKNGCPVGTAVCTNQAFYFAFALHPQHFKMNG